MKKNIIKDITVFLEIGLQPGYRSDSDVSFGSYVSVFSGLINISRINTMAEESKIHFWKSGYKITNPDFRLDSNYKDSIVYSMEFMAEDGLTGEEFFFPLTAQISRKGDVSGEDFQDIVHAFLGNELKCS